MDEMTEFACRIAADMAEDGEAECCIVGSPADLVRCMGGLILVAASFAEVSPEKLAMDALAIARNTKLSEKTAVPEEVYEAVRKWKERQNG